MKSRNRSQCARWLGCSCPFAALVYLRDLCICNEPILPTGDIDLKAAYLTFVGLAIVGLITIAGQAFLKSIEWSTEEPKAPSAPAAPTQGSQENHSAE